MEVAKSRVCVLQTSSHVLRCIEDAVKDQIEIHPQG